MLYGKDLAFIHDRGHSGYAVGAAPGLLRLLARQGITGGLVVDLGCGSGRWARELHRAGYDVLGIDRSRGLLALAKRNAPRSRFHAASLWTAELPACDAVTSIGECLNYDAGAAHRLPALFRKIRTALRPGGMFVFDMAEPGRLPAEGVRRGWSEGPGWAVMVETAGDPESRTLTRRIVSFRRTGRLYRRSRELHRLRLYSREEVFPQLADAGFDARAVDRFGRFRLPPGICGFVAIRRE
jgi:SAM-dependent methyltransferase